MVYFGHHLSYIKDARDVRAMEEKVKKPAVMIFPVFFVAVASMLTVQQLASAQMIPSPKVARAKGSSQPQASADDWWDVVCWLTTPYIDWPFCPGRVLDPPPPKQLEPKQDPPNCDIYGPCQE